MYCGKYPIKKNIRFLNVDSQLEARPKDLSDEHDMIFNELTEYIINKFFNTDISYMYDKNDKLLIAIHNLL